MAVTDLSACTIILDADDMLCDFSDTFNHFMQLMHMSYSDLMDLYLKDTLNLPSDSRARQFILNVDRQFEDWHDDVRARLPLAQRARAHKSLDVLKEELKLPELCNAIERALADQTLASIVVIEHGRAKVYRR